jgi:DNA-3-methyladenine glycosylase
LKPNRIEEILAKPALEAAPLLLGCELVRQTPQGEIRLRLVETEAYHQDDPASHTYRGLTKRTVPMFKAGGHLYVYCINIVTGKEGVGEAVLLRAAEPIEGIEIMLKNRYSTNFSHLDAVQGSSEERAKRRKATLSERLSVTDTAMRQKPAGTTGSAGGQGKAVRNLANGPGKLAQALGVTSTALSGAKLGKKSLQLLPPENAISPREIVVSRRIGIRQATEVPWRFYLKENAYVSKY